MARTIRTAKKSTNSSGASKRQKVEPLNPGDEVEIHNLVDDVDLNGKSGRLVKYHSGRNRWEVHIIGDGMLTDHLIKAENLKLKREDPEPLNPGDEVVFHGLTTNVDLNGKSGELVEYDSDGDRWEVKTKFDVCISGDTDKVVFAKAENLKRKDLAAPDRERKSMSCPTHVYVLILEEWHHGWGGGHATTKVIGVYISKEAAVLASGEIQTSWGTFNKEIEPRRGTFGGEFEHKDNRKNPPDDGILIQLGGRDIGEGDYARLKLQKMPLL